MSEQPKQTRGQRRRARAKAARAAEKAAAKKRAIYATHYNPRETKDRVDSWIASDLRARGIFD